MIGFDDQFDIGSRRIGGDAPVLVIAEAGVAHFGNSDKADALVDLAAEAGADVFKTQAFVTDRLIASSLPEWRDRLRPKEVGFSFLRRMKDRCDHRGITFMCTAHDEEALRWVDDLDVPAYKIGSGERGNLPFLAALARRGKPLILSTGTHGRVDIDSALNCIADAGCRQLALLHCVTAYPVPYAEAGLNAMQALRRIFSGPVGYSDHTAGNHVALAAVALGARVVEKHIALDFDVPNAQDWKVSVRPHDLPDFVRQIRDIEAALGDEILGSRPCEQPALTWALKSLVAGRTLAEGTVLTADDVLAKRPGGGIPPSEIARVVGRRLQRSLAIDQQVTWEDIV